VPGQPLREHPSHDVRCFGVRLKPVRPPPPRRVHLVRVRPRVTEPVSVWRAAAEIPALLPGLRGHRGAHPDPGTGDLPLGRQAQGEHGLLVVLGVPVDPAADLRHPQADAVVLEQRRHRRVLAAVERPLVLPDHDRCPPAIGVGELRDQGGGLRAARPRQHPALPRVEELRRDHPAPGHEHYRLLQLPGPRRLGVLPVLGRDPPVEREPYAPSAPHPAPAAGQALRPRRQRIPGRPLTARGRYYHRRRAHPGHPQAGLSGKALPFHSPGMDVINPAPGRRNAATSYYGKAE
jgi:hypothetical protein